MSKTQTIDWSKAKATEQNPCGIYGVDFIEYSGPDAGHFEKLFAHFGFSEIAKINGKNINDIYITIYPFIEFIKLIEIIPLIR